MIDIGKRIGALREARDISQTELSRRAGLGRSSISEIENGKNQPNFATLTQIAEALGITVGTLVDGKIPVASFAETLPQEVQDFLLSQEGMQYLKIGMKAKDFAITPEILTQVIEAMSMMQDVEKGRK